jgi:hypothetical protein
MSGFDREKYDVKRIDVRRYGEDPYSGEPFRPRRVEVEVEFYDGGVTCTHTVKYKIEGSTAVFRRNKANTESLRERHLRTTAVADEVVADLIFVQSVDRLADAVPEVNTHE